MNIISIVNQKGGVGKTTSSCNISAILYELGYSVLAIDMDPQGNLSQSLDIDSDRLDTTIYEVLIGTLNLKDAIIKTNFGLDIIPANINLANAELEIASAMSRESILKRAFEDSGVDYDYVILDLPPSLGLLSLNALTLSESVIVPVDASVFAVNGISQLANMIQLVKKNLNPSISILGAVLTKADDRINITKRIKESLKDIFEDDFFDTYIHQNSKILESQSEKMPINFYDKNSRGYKEYLNLTKEVIKRGH